MIDLRGMDPPHFFFAHLKNGVIVKCGFSSKELGESTKEGIRESIRSPVARKLKEDLYTYFSGKKIGLNYAVRLSVPEFTARVLFEVSKIPYGETKTYKEVAERLGTKAYRAVGGVLARNPVPVIIPCHRVVGVGDLGGYMGGKESGIRIKKFLLEIEGHRL